jgi:protein-glutamine gamma-glutamyltransferase
MTHLRATSLLTHLALAASGLCLAIVAMPLLLEMPFVLVAYLLFVGWSWRLGGQWILPAWAANLLALVIAAGAIGYVLLRVHSEFAFEWTHEIPVQVALLPLLAPVLMALLLVRLVRSRTHRDALQLHGIALLQVALGCVLASGTLFGFFLAAYFVLGLCSLAAHEARRRRRESLPINDLASPPKGARSWPRFGLIWLALVLLVAAPLFLLTPRLDGPDWEPLSRMGNPKTRSTFAKTGFSEEIDLRRVGTLSNDEAIAFTVTITNLEGNSPSRLPGDQRWRGTVLDRYESGVWRSELTSFSNATMFMAGTSATSVGRGTSRLLFQFQGKTSSLFLAEPIYPEPTPGRLPIAVIEPSRQRPSLFFEAGGTVLSSTYLPHPSYRYTQDIDPSASRTRYPAVRVSDVYQLRLLRCSAPGMADLTARLLSNLVEEEPLRRAIRDRHPDGSGRNPLPHQLEPLPPDSWARIAGLLENHLARSGSYTYDMASSRADLALDPTVDFLTNVRRGSCERYASGLALMLRSIGIPARIVKGYRGWDLESGQYVVRQRHAHAWVEALVPAEGPGPLRMDWITLDPEPSREEEPASSTIARWWEQGRRGGQSFWQEMVLGYGSRRQSALWEDLSAKGRFMVSSLSLLVASLILRRIVRRLRRRRVGPRETFALGTLFARLRVLLLARCKLALLPAQTPAELAELARPLLAGDPATRDLADLPARVVESYYKERYGRISAAPAEVAALSAGLDRLARVGQAF